MIGLLFAMTLLVSAGLLFVVQPMFGKMVLPLLGGAPAVWNTCMVFYQAVLLAGYAYAHWGHNVLGSKRQSFVHLGLLLLAWVVLPIGVARWTLPPFETSPVLWLGLVLVVSVGLPFFVLSATSPMLQAWFAQGSRHAPDPYWLYAASNVGSLGGLLAYPFLIEPQWTLRQQAWLWAVGYAVLTALIFLCAVWLWREGSKAAEAISPETLEQPSHRDVRPDASSRTGPPSVAEAENRVPTDGMSPSETRADPGKKSLPVRKTTAEKSPGDLPGIGSPKPDWMDRFWWIALAFAPSSLLLGVTTYITTDLAAAPLLWVLPLALYLLSFVIVFARWRLVPRRGILWAHAVVVVVMAASYYLISVDSPVMLALVFLMHLGLFFLTALVCHGELAAQRPAAQHLTEFYLWMALGGVLGGAFNALLAPWLFAGVYEYPLLIAGACLLRPSPSESSVRKMSRAWDFGIPMLLVVLYGTLARELREHNWLRDFLAEVLPAAWLQRIGPGPLATAVFLGLASISTLCLTRRPVRFGMGVFGLLVVSLLYCGEKERPIYAARSFFGVLRVYEIRYHKGTEREYVVHQLLHGTTNHGMQSFDPRRREEAWTYYHQTGPVGMIFEAMQWVGDGFPKEVGVVGLGAGTMAAYGQVGRRITFFEIDPAVVRIAENPYLFTYLTDCRARGGQVDIVLGDARLQLAKQPPGRFDLLLVDAFSSDSIPLHLLTREAVKLYLERLRPEGLLAVHISNRHLDLRPVLGNLADQAGVTALICEDADETAEGKYQSTWVVLGHPGLALKILKESPWWEPLPPDPGKRLWTDDYSNLLDVLDWSWEDLRKLPRLLGLEAAGVF